MNVSVIDSLIALGISKSFTVFVVSMLPIVELRGALPVAINAFHIPWYYALPIAVVGNILPVPFLLLFLGSVRRLAARLGVVGRAVEWVLSLARRRGQLVERYGRVGLMLFVSVPLPVTGAWTGALVAFLLGLRFRDAFLSICLGVLVAGVIVTVLCLLGWIGAVIAGVALAALVTVALWPRRAKNAS
ncbi:MAG: small multi-drug export protein [Chloroflexota bacterium]|nr:small multi-drug export protein [Chloroflexota bacterium]